MGDERRREREVRPEHGGPRCGERDAEGGGARALPQARAFPRRLAGAGHLARSSGRCAKRRAFTRSSRSWATNSNTSTSAAASAWITTAPAPPSTARRITRSRNTRNDIVYNIMDVCDAEKRAAPGHRQRKRARDRRASFRARRRGVRRDRERRAEHRRSRSTENDHKLVARHPRRAAASSSAATGSRRLHDAQQIKEEAQQMFDLGLLDLEIKAKIETRLLADRRSRS